jgi:hypothetical protein
MLLGHEISISSTLLQLAMPTVDFKKVEVQTLVLHTIHQVRPANGRIERASYFPFTKTSFCNKMLDLLRDAL